MKKRGDHITTYTKLHFNPINPNPENIVIKDIAHALSLLCRGGGHFENFHSVASHCLECASEAKARNYTSRVQLACLLHDASEAYLADITRPVKKHLNTYSMIEEQLLQTIYNKYLDGLNPDEKVLVDEVDNALLYHEFYYFMGEEIGEKPHLLSSPDFSFLPFKEVENAYLSLFYKLCTNIAEEHSQ